VLAGRPTWELPAYDSVRRQVLAWLEKSGADETQRGKVQMLWPAKQADAVRGGELLDLLAGSAAAVDPAAARLVAACERPRPNGKMPSLDWLADENTPPLIRHNLRLLLARHLIGRKLYDEALAQLEGLRPADVVDPASLLFHQGVAHHWLIHQEEGIESLGRLLEREAAIPARYRSLARLMHADLSQIKERDTLDHVGRRVKDIGRRLELGRADEQVQKIQQGVIESLDKMIEEMEKRQQEQQAGAANLAPSRPAEESRPAAGKGEGRVERKRLDGEGKSWGGLPARQREQALQQIGRDYPPHFRDVIEDYFRRLASEEEGGE